jgi:putative aldouronate transport system substrate-binding protein
VFTGKDFIYRNQDPQTKKIYSIPSYRVALAQRNIFIRKDWLEKLGMPMPASIDQFHDTLVAFRDKDPGNVGKSKVIPFLLGRNVWWGLSDFINNSIDRNMSDKDRWINNVHERYLTMPGYKEGVRRMNQWYNEGLIYKDFPIAQDESNFLKTGVSGAFSGNWDVPYRPDDKVNEELANNVPGAVWVPVDLNLVNKGMMDKVGLQIFIPAFTKNQTGALRYLNWLAKPENYQFLQRGNEGVNHQIENGVPRTLTRPAGDPWFQNSPNNLDYTMQMNGVEMGSQELNSRVIALSYGNTPAADIVNAYAISVKDARAAPVYQATTKVNQYAQTLADKSDALLSQSITAPVARFDSVWDAGYKDWLASGAQEVINERTSLYK